jgi:hypothetical protein
MNTVAFWKASGERAVKTFLQTYFGIALAGDAVLNVFEFSWVGPELGIALGATILSLVTSLLSSGAGNPGPSLANETALHTPAHSRGAHEQNPGA